MERLTFEGNFCDIAQCRDLACKQGGTCTQRLVWERLKSYEDTGWTPEMLRKLGENAGHLWDFAQAAENMTVGRLKELAEADKDGRVVVLPCKVYETDGVSVYEHTVREVIYETAGGPAFDKNAIGKSIFLTRAEAERAIQEMEGKKNGNETSM